MRALQKADPEGLEGREWDLSCLKYMFIAGEHCEHETRLWTEKRFGVPCLDNWWQTETAHAITTTAVGLGHSTNPPKDVTGMPVPGFDIRILREDMSEANVNELG